METTIEPASTNATSPVPNTTSGRLRQALKQIPRHLFIPTTAWTIGDDHQPHLIDKDLNPDDWWTAAHSDLAIAIHDDDSLDARSTMLPTSTVLRLLELLDVKEHHRILEIGTGTAWTTAMLTHLVGDGNLTTLEFDSQVAALAKANLSALGLSPRSHVVVSEVGYASATPCDRVIVNFGIADIPYQWIAQCRPGGIIVLPWTPGPGSGHALRLTAIDHAHAIGTFHGHAKTVPQRRRTWPPDTTGQVVTSRTVIDPREITNAGPGAHLLIAHLAPGVGWHTAHSDAGTISLRLFETDNPSRSWATCDHHPRAHDFAVTQHGERNLWDEISDAYLRWCSWGKPTQHRFGLTIDEWHGQTLWLDHPDGTLAW